VSTYEFERFHPGSLPKKWDLSIGQVMLTTAARVYIARRLTARLKRYPSEQYSWADAGNGRTAIRRDS
jgi:hypothetical protein